MEASVGRSATPTVREDLQALEIFQGLPGRYLDVVAEVACRAEFDEGEHLLRQSAPCDLCYVIVDGRVGVFSEIRGRNPQRVDRLGPGELVGWSWLLAPYCWRFSALAERPTRTVALDTAELRARCEAAPGFGYPILQSMFGVVARRLEGLRLRRGGEAPE